MESPGLYEANHQLILGLVGAQVHNADDIRQLVVKTTAAGAPVRVADVARPWKMARMPVYTTVTANGKNRSAVELACVSPTSNTVAVADAVAAQVTSCAKSCRRA